MEARRGSKPPLVKIGRKSALELESRKSLSKEVKQTNLMDEIIMKGH